MKITKLLLFILVAALLTSCATPAATEPEVIEVITTEIVEQTVQVEVEKVVTATPERQEVPAIGGTFTISLPSEHTTLDPQVTNDSFIPRLIGGQITAVDPETGEYVPYLTESVDLSEDGLTWTIRFKEGMLWHDGTPFTADDYIFTMERARLSKSMTANALLTGFDSIEKIDDLTVQINMATPNGGMQYGFTTAFLQPLPKHYIEAVGDDEFARHPIGLGSYKFVEWATGDRIVLWRNPDFTWGPAFSNGTRPFIETVEIRFIPEYATSIAGLEAAEIDYAHLVESRDKDRLEEAGFTILSSEKGGIGPNLLMNLEREPFGDIRIRKAINMAIQRDALVSLVLEGYGTPLYGPVRPATAGYWPGSEYIGYQYDLEEAKALMADAGFETNEDGMLVKDGETLTLVLETIGTFQKPAEIIQSQLKDLGIKVELSIVEYGVYVADLTDGNYDLAISSWSWDDTTLLFGLFHSSMVGIFNEARVSDPNLDSLLVQIYMAPSKDVLESAGADAQKLMIEQAYVAPLYNTIYFSGINPKIHGYQFTNTGTLYLFDAYIETIMQ